MRRAVFLDRDGTIIREAEYLSDLSQLEVLPGVPQALRRLHEDGFVLVVVTNQSGVARGYFDPAFVEAVHAELSRRVAAGGGHIDAFYVCPHHPDFTGGCDCRKPLPGLVRQACAQWDIDPARSWVVGDKECDVELAREARCRAALVRTGYGADTERVLREKGVGVDVVADDLAAAVEEMVKE